MGFEFERGKYNCPLCGSGTGNNKTSAFIVYPGDRGFYCHACVKGGSVINFMMHWKGLSKYEAIKELAGIYGFEKIDTEKYKPVTYQVFDKVRTFYKIEDALKWENDILDKSHKECIRKVRVYIAILNGHGIIDDSHWLCKCLRPTFTNPTPWQLLTIINYLGVGDD
jgi:hypothetical protein